MTLAKVEEPDKLNPHGEGATLPAVHFNDLSWAQMAELSANQGALGVAVAGELLGSVVGREHGLAIAGRQMDELLQDVRPKTMVERMLLEQMVVGHAQILHCSKRMNQIYPIDLDAVEQMGLVVSCLQADFRRSLAAIKDWRAPAQTLRAGQLNVEQLNMAQQQQVNNHGV